MWKNYLPDHKNYILAARITGEIQSAFPNVLKNTKKHIKSIKNTNIILLPCTEFLQDNSWVNIQNFLGNRVYIPISGNGNFVLSAIENLTGSNALISIRNRGIFSRPFTLIQKLQAKSKFKFKEKEQKLINKLEETKQHLLGLEQNKKESNSISASIKQKDEEENFRKELVDTRRQLREVQRELNKDIERIELIIKLINIIFITLLVSFAGIIFWLYCIYSSKRESNGICLLYNIVDRA